MMQHNGWQPNLGPAGTLTDAGQMDQRDYAEAWAWVYFMLHSDPENRELLISYLADLRTDGGAESAADAAGGAERTTRADALAQFLTARNGDVVAGKKRLKT